MILLTDKSKCCGCAACASICPVGCITMAVDSEGFPYPKVDLPTCIDCGRCERVCPFLNVSEVAPVKAALVARTHDEELLYKSSSGGIFTELCRPVLEAGGAVYGVAMEADCRGCSFVRADTLEGIAPMRGSKYLQADSAGVYERVAADLKMGRRVLFSGTPCQANALRRYLGGKCDGLLVVDFLCHGVPSPRLWEKSIEAFETRRGVKVTSVDFRCKEVSWRRFSREAKCRDGVLYEPLYKSPFLRMFLKNYCLRESCYTCEAKLTRAADITIADCWGIQDVLPGMADELGFSLVIVRTEEGARRLDAIAKSLEMHVVDYGVAVSHNSSAYESANRPPERDLFFDELDKLGYAGMIRKYGTPRVKERVKRAAKRTFGKVGLLDIARKLRGGRSHASDLRYGVLLTYDVALSGEGKADES